MNKAICQDNSFLTSEEPSLKEDENKSYNKELLSSPELSPEKIISNVIIPKREKKPLNNSNSTELNKSFLKPSKLNLKSSPKNSKENSICLAFAQPMEDLELRRHDAAVKEYEKMNSSFTSPMGKSNKSKNLRQTILKFPKNTVEMEESLLKNCEVVGYQISKFSIYKLFL